MRPKVKRLNCEHINRGVEPIGRGIVACVVAEDGWRKYAGACCRQCALNDHRLHAWVDRQVGQYIVWAPWLREVSFEADPAALDPIPETRLSEILAYRDRTLPGVTGEMDAILQKAGLPTDPEARRQSTASTPRTL